MRSEISLVMHYHRFDSQIVCQPKAKTLRMHLMKANKKPTVKKRRRRRKVRPQKNGKRRSIRRSVCEIFCCKNHFEMHICSMPRSRGLYCIPCRRCTGFDMQVEDDPKLLALKQKLERLQKKDGRVDYHKHFWTTVCVTRGCCPIQFGLVAGCGTKMEGKSDSRPGVIYLVRRYHYHSRHPSARGAQRPSQDLCSAV